MSHNTIAINQRMDQFDGHESVWLFGYGSLIYKADFPFIERRAASIAGWTRRFWQGSHGMAYLITPEVFGHLDHREKNGYLRLATEIAFDDDTATLGLVYIATADNAAYLGEASEQAIARQIAASSGPSGPNRDYLLDLAHALREMGKIDAHVFAIEKFLLP
jgi:cation transport protein ChaC